MNIRKTPEYVGPGIILAPYILAEHTEESLKKYNEFMSIYSQQHEVCPKCGSKGHRTTLAGYILDWSKPDEYKDENNCVCSNCGDKHIYHDRISVEQFNSLKNGK